MCGMDTRAGLFLLEGLGIDNSVSGLILSNNFLLFYERVSVFRKEVLIKNSMCRMENDILLYMMYKAINIILILNKYHLEYSVSLLVQTLLKRNIYTL